MKAQTFTATWNGAVVGRRRSPRPYKFAVICQPDKERDRKAAYDYVVTSTDRENYKYYLEVVAEGVSHFSFLPAMEANAEVARATGLVDGGFDAYVGRLRQWAIERFEAAKIGGYYEPQVHGWSMSDHNAQKMAAACHAKVLGVVPAVCA